MPHEQHVPNHVEGMVSDEVRSTVVNFNSTMLLSDAELGAVCLSTNLRGKYVDPVLDHDPGKHAEFVAELISSELIRFNLTTSSECGVFFVTKRTKDGRVRLGLVIDARRTNRLFERPPWCPLGSDEN